MPEGTARISFRTWFPTFDGLRAFAILGVMMLHYLAGAPDPPLLGRAFHEFVLLGWYGVDLFFVLSGFLITGILLDTREQTGFFRNFYMRRTLRIFPLYYATLIVLFVALPLTVGRAGGFPPIAMDVQVWFWTYLSNIFYATQGWAAGPVHTPHFWSLAVEEQFYLIWPAVVRFTPRRHLVWVFLAVIAGSLGWRVTNVLQGAHFIFTEVITPSRVDNLAFGALVALAIRAPSGRERLRAALPVLFAIAALAIGAVVWFRETLWIEDPVVRSIGLTATAFAFGTLITLGAVCREGGVVYRVLTLSPLRFIGRYSYAMYVFHYPVMIVLKHAGFTVDSAIARVGGLVAGEALFVGVNAGLTLILSLASWHALEKRALALKSRFAYATPSKGKGPHRKPAKVRGRSG